MRKRTIALGIVLVLLASGMVAGVSATAQAKSDYGLVAEWHFDEGSGSVVKDSSGKGNDGTIYGAKWVGGKYGKALRFDGVDDYVDIGNPSFLSNTAGSISFWVVASKAGTPFGVSDVSASNRFILMYMRKGGTGWHNDRLDIAHIDNGGYSYSLYTPEDSCQADNWYHVAVTSDGNTISIYISGVKQTLYKHMGSNNGNWFGDLTGANKFTIGALVYNNGEIHGSVDGIIDEVSIYNRALTADEIKTLYEGKKPKVTLTKSASPSTIQEGETTTISIRVENTGTGDAKAVEVTDTIPLGFKIISGSKSESIGELKSGDYRTSEYTLKATGSGKFTCDPATATYKDTDGNSYSAVSNSVSIQVGGEVPVGADSDGDGWSDEKEKEMGTNSYSVDSDGDGLKDPEDPNPTVPEEKKETPGFEVVLTIAGILAVAYVLRRRK